MSTTMSWTAGTVGCGAATVGRPTGSSAWGSQLRASARAADTAERPRAGPVTAIKGIFKANPERFEKWFNRAAPLLKKVSKQLGMDYLPNETWEPFFYKPFDKELAKEFKNVYMIGPDDWYDYYPELSRRVKKGDFVKYGAAKDDILYSYEESSPFYEEFMRWVWHEEYGPDCVAAAKRMLNEIQTWE